jgi:[acyl-carrier-protein] S-malonyltransferase
MAAVLKTDRAHVERICLQTDGIVEIANLNAPGQTVISGEARAVAVASEQLASGGARVVALDVSAPFHCSLMRPAAERLAGQLRRINFHAPSFDIVSNVKADILHHIGDAPGLLEEQVTAPVRWVESIERLQALGTDRFLEFGSGKVLSGLVKRILKSADIRPIYDVKTLQEAL